MSCLSSLEYSEGLTYRNFLSEKQMLDAIISLRPLSSFTQTSFESKKIVMAKDSILTVLCLYTSLFRILYKECKHTRELTQTWVALNSSCVNKSPTPLIPLDVLCLVDHHSGPTIWYNHSTIENVREVG